MEGKICKKCRINFIVKGSRLCSVCTAEREVIRNKNRYINERSIRMARSKVYYANHREKYKTREIEKRMHIRALVFNHYGIICSWCCENDFDCLEIDHINNDGKKHREEIGPKIYPWIIKNNYPECFKTLCAACNQLKKKNHGKLPEYRKDKYLYRNEKSS